ncbi:putative Quinone oxidoreductase 1 [Candidatus Xenohaliotis californiensis]|uniref:Quinone oxidoreductase 1 n=1 Tax=Candidatus Xenohaliotis californiensis TaxID=84677 RepID=A0ABM9N6Y0_9RICK|nr:putative Quinone oxidoreductase 1 [Candidatus Xenohaliotis californiensis]
MPQAFIKNKNGTLEKANFKIKPSISPNSVLIKQHYIGINKHDLSQSWKSMKKFTIPGTEAVGIIENIGNNVKNLKIGDRVGYCLSDTGACCTHRIVNKKILYKIPDYISDKVAAASMFKGITAYSLVRRVFFACPSSFIMVYGITGGIGYFIAQWLQAIKCSVIGSTSAAKMSIAKKHKFQDLLLDHYTECTDKLLQFTENMGVMAIYDPIGEALYQKSIQFLSIYGTLINYGHLSGEISNIKTKELTKKSLYLTCPNIKHYQDNSKEQAVAINALFTLIKEGKLQPVVSKIYKFNDVPWAYQDLATNNLIYSNIIEII